MRRMIAIAACLAFLSLVAVGCGDDDSSSETTEATTTTTTTSTQQEAVDAVVSVSIGDNFYKPKDLTIQRGQSIKWKNDGAVTHTVTSDEDSDVSFDSGDLAARAAYALKPGSAGKISYYCTIHGSSQSGTITVTR